MAEEGEQDVLSGLLSVCGTLGETDLTEADYNESASSSSTSQRRRPSSSVMVLL